VARWLPATTANDTPSRSAPIAATVACLAARILLPVIDVEQSMTITSSTSDAGAGPAAPSPAVTVTIASTRFASTGR
jgi:hypothetical protein